MEADSAGLGESEQSVSERDASAQSAPEPNEPERAEIPNSAGESKFPALRVGVLLLLGLWLGPLLPAWSPSFAVEISEARRELFAALPGRPFHKDPWGEWPRWGCLKAGEVVPDCPIVSEPGGLLCEHPWGNYSSGPNEVDEGGRGDDLAPRRPLPAWALAPIHWLPFLALAWLAVLGAARRARDRELGPRELGWALLVGLPPGALAWEIAAWGSGAETWKRLFGANGGIFHWQVSLALSISGIVFLGAWALSRPLGLSEEELVPPSPQGPSDRSSSAAEGAS